MSEVGARLPPFDPRWPLERQRAHIALAGRRLDARRGVPDPTLHRDLAAFAAAIAALPPPHQPTQEPTMPATKEPVTSGHPQPPNLPLPPLTAPVRPPSTFDWDAFDATQWEKLTVAARDHATSEIARATAQRALLATEIAQLEQTAAALERALRAFRELPPPITARRARRRPGDGLGEALEWADAHGGILDTRLFTASAGRWPIAQSTIRRLVKSGQLVHISGPKSGRYQRPTPPAPPAPPSEQV